MADPTAKGVRPLMSDNRRLSSLGLTLPRFIVFGNKLFKEWYKLAAEFGIEGDAVNSKANSNTDTALAHALVDMLRKRDVVLGDLYGALDRIGRRDLVAFLRDAVTVAAAARPAAGTRVREENAVAVVVVDTVSEKESDLYKEWFKGTNEEILRTPLVSMLDSSEKTLDDLEASFRASSECLLQMHCGPSENLPRWPGDLVLQTYRDAELVVQLMKRWHRSSPRVTFSVLVTGSDWNELSQRIETTKRLPTPNKVHWDMDLYTEKLDLGISVRLILQRLCYEGFLDGLRRKNLERNIFDRLSRELQEEYTRRNSSEALYIYCARAAAKVPAAEMVRVTGYRRSSTALVIPASLCDLESRLDSLGPGTVAVRVQQQEKEPRTWVATLDRGNPFLDDAAAWEKVLRSRSIGSSLWKDRVRLLLMRDQTALEEIADFVEEVVETVRAKKTTSLWEYKLNEDSTAAELMSVMDEVGGGVVTHVSAENVARILLFDAPLASEHFSRFKLEEYFGFERFSSVLSWTDDLWTQVTKQLLSEQSVRIQLAERLGCAPTSLDKLADCRLTSVEELGAHLLALSLLKELESLRTILRAQEEEECWQCAHRLGEVWVRFGQDEDTVPLEVPIDRAVLAGSVREQLSPLAFCSASTTVVLKKCSRSELEDALELADRVKQSSWANNLQFQMDLKRLTNKRVQQVIQYCGVDLLSLAAVFDCGQKVLTLVGGASVELAKVEILLVRMAEGKVEYLCSQLKRMTSLRSLVLIDNEIGSEGMKHLSKG
eukprot:CAMPEP_0174229762 /NCGR_PEP_ID=MMETSP0417-20130205/636_1 /TAXON_ID=242541 /ORGANISM="Mayorella sp, Strain BSH-02190019" /LENGTH=772 /DNA_ID=CAMNT_0015307343 /DNA_START=105 /DNA_END=2420 /DNA_ORIENTATION=-